MKQNTKALFEFLWTDFMIKFPSPFMYDTFDRKEVMIETNNVPSDTSTTSSQGLLYGRRLELAL